MPSDRKPSLIARLIDDWGFPLLYAAPMAGLLITGHEVIASLAVLPVIVYGLFLYHRYPPPWCESDESNDD